MGRKLFAALLSHTEVGEVAADHIVYRDLDYSSVVEAVRSGASVYFEWPPCRYERRPVDSTRKWSGGPPFSRHLEVGRAVIPRSYRYASMKC